MTILEFFSEHWFLAWCALWLVWIIYPALIVVENTIKILLFRLPNRLFRCMNVLIRGWPPKHLDADGDFKPESEIEE